MARVKKVNNEIKKRQVLKNQKLERRLGNRKNRERILIVCEGEKTEPLYFKEFAKLLPKSTAQVAEAEKPVIDITGRGMNTLRLVQETITIKNQREDESGIPYTQVWAVFDKDDFPKELYNEAINSALDEGIQCAYSNEAFELWYLLHFNDYEDAAKCHQYAKRLSSALGEKYIKNDPKIYEKLQRLGNEELACSRAKKLCSIAEASKPNMFADHNPSTSVYKLVRILREIIDNS